MWANDYSNAIQCNGHDHSYADDLPADRSAANRPLRTHSVHRWLSRVMECRRPCVRGPWAVVLAAFLVGAPGGFAVAESDAATQAAGTTFRDCPNCPEMVAIPAGTFLMGSSAADSERDLAAMNVLERFLAKSYLDEEHPQHQVRIGHPFGLGKYLVTRGQFAAFVRATGYASAGGCTFYRRSGYRYHDDGSWQNPDFPQTDQDPVVCMSSQDAQAYIDWLNENLRWTITGEAGRLYRLPSESEWEYAARAGQQTARWWGDDIGTNNADCNGCGSSWDDQGTAPVGSFRPNQFGLYDMLGNAGEWMQDCWQTSYDRAPSDGTAWTAGDCQRRAVRGRDWTSEIWSVRTTARIGLRVNQKSNDVGFRVAKTLP